MASTRRRRFAIPLALVLSTVVAACTPAAAQPALQLTTVRPASPTPSLVPTAAPSATRRATASPTAAPTRTPASAHAQPFAMNLYQDGDFVPQHTFDWCVGASVQMAWNLVRGDRRASYDDQRALWEMARDRSSNAFGGANPHGWASVLTEIGLGSYELVSLPTSDEALRVAASALRETNRPVGLVMWRGRHAWVMSGFESLGDPAEGEAFTVSGVRVLDPLYPHGSGLWGPSPAPNSLLSPAELAAQFVIRERRHWSMQVEPGYLLVLPV